MKRRKYTIGRPFHDHIIQVSRHSLGQSFFNRPTYGTTIICTCGWHDRINEPPSRSKVMVNHRYNVHVHFVMGDPLDFTRVRIPGGMVGILRGRVLPDSDDFTVEIRDTPSRGVTTKVFLPLSELEML